VRWERRGGGPAAARGGRRSTGRCGGLAGPGNSRPVAHLFLMSFSFFFSLIPFTFSIKPVMNLLRIWLGSGTYMLIWIV